MSKISVIVPVYKVEQYIHRCVNSILSQSYADFELILVDDGSPDNSSAICDEYAANDSRVKVIHKENGGLSSARNAGIDWVFANSDSEWITFIDSDDWIHSQYLSALYNAVVNSEADICVCEYERVSDLSGEKNIHCKHTVMNVEEYYIQHHLIANIAWAKLYPKKALEDIRYPIGKIHEDEFTTYKVLFRYEKVAVIDEPLYFYYVNPAGIMGKRGADEKIDRVLALEERVEYFGNTLFKRAYQVSVESYMTVLLRMRRILRDQNTKDVEMIRLMNQKITRLKNDHVKRLSTQGQKAVQKILSQDRNEQLVHLPNRVLKKCFGSKRYEQIKMFLKH